MGISCHHCSFRFNQRKNFYNHLRMVHDYLSTCELCKDILPEGRSKTSKICKSEQRLKNRRIICAVNECNEKFNYHKSLRDHVRKVHNIDLQYEELKFSSLQDFFTWKKEYESKNVSTYIAESKKKKLSDGCSRNYYNCFRSFDRKSVSRGLRSIKKLGTNKIGKTCTSRIEVLESKEGIFVKLWGKHVGHSIDVRRTTLHESTRADIAEKIHEGVPFQDILHQIKNSGLSEENQQRLNLVKRKDLHNIKKAYERRKRQSSSVNVKSVENKNDLRKKNKVLLSNSEQGKFSKFIECNVDPSSYEPDILECKFDATKKLIKNRKTSHSSKSDMLLSKLELIPHLFKGIDFNESITQEATELADSLISLARSLSEYNANKTVGIIKAENVSDTIEYLAVHPEFDHTYVLD